MIKITKSEKETRKLAQKFAKTLEGGEIIALEGDLGGGKTTFVQGLACGLGIKQWMRSPTFVIMRQYVFDRTRPGRTKRRSRPPQRGGRCSVLGLAPPSGTMPARPRGPDAERRGGRWEGWSPHAFLSDQASSFYHIDCYRIKKPKELLDLGFKKILKGKNNIIVIEWADRIRETLPKETIWVKFEILDENKREIKISNFQ